MPAACGRPTELSDLSRGGPSAALAASIDRPRAATQIAGRRSQPMRMPDPDRDVIARRAAIAADLRQIVPGEGVIDDEDERRAYECDGLTAYRQLPMLVVLPSTTAAGVARPALLQRAQAQGRAARRRHLALGRRAAARRRHPAGPRQVQPHPRDRLREPLRRRAARRHQPRHHQRRPARRLLLRPRSVEPDRLHHRRQRRRELRRRALPEIRPHHQQRAGRRAGADRRRRWSASAASIWTPTATICWA